MMHTGLATHVLRKNGCNDCPDYLVRELSSRSETCREYKRLVIFNVKTFINFMVCKIALPYFLQNQFVDLLP